MPKRASHAAHRLSVTGSSSPMRPSRAPEGREQRRQLRAHELRIEPADQARQVPGALHRVLERERVAGAQRPHERPGERRVAAQRRCGRAHDELRVAGGAVVLDPEAVKPGPLGRERHALVVPERGGRRNPAGQQVGDGVEADRDRPDRPRPAACAGDDRAQDGAIAGHAGDPDQPVLQIPGRADRRCGDHGRQRPLDERHDPHQILPGRAGDGQVVDVEHREVDAPGLEQLDRVGGGAGDDHLQAQPVAPVITARQGRVDPGVHGIGREVEDQAGRAHTLVRAAAGGEERREHEHDQAEPHPAGG